MNMTTNMRLICFTLNIHSSKNYVRNKLLCQHFCRHRYPSSAINNNNNNSNGIFNNFKCYSIVWLRFIMLPWGKMKLFFSSYSFTSWAEPEGNILTYLPNLICGGYLWKGLFIKAEWHYFAMKDAGINVDFSIYRYKAI